MELFKAFLQNGKNVLRNSNFSMEAYSQEAMINYRHSIFIGDNFYGIAKLKTNMIFVPPASRNKFSPKFDISEED